MQDLIREGLPIIYLSMEEESSIEELARELSALFWEAKQTSDSYILCMIDIGLFLPLLEGIRQKLINIQSMVMLVNTVKICHCIIYFAQIIIQTEWQLLIAALDVAAESLRQ